MELTVSLDAKEGIDVVSAKGEVDAYTAPTLDESLTSLISSGSKQIIVDLSGVEFIDSTGLGIIVKALKSVRDQGGWLKVVANSDRVVKVFRITGLEAEVDLAVSVDDAISS